MILLINFAYYYQSNNDSYLMSDSAYLPLINIVILND